MDWQTEVRSEVDNLIRCFLGDASGMNKDVFTEFYKEALDCFDRGTLDREQMETIVAAKIEEDTKILQTISRNIVAKLADRKRVK